MRWKVYQKKEKPDNLKDWHYYFAYLPKKVGAERVWLELIQRKWHFDTAKASHAGYRGEWRYRNKP